VAGQTGGGEVGNVAGDGTGGETVTACGVLEVVLGSVAVEAGSGSGSVAVLAGDVAEIAGEVPLVGEEGGIAGGHAGVVGLQVEAVDAALALHRSRNKHAGGAVQVQRADKALASSGISVEAIGAAIKTHGEVQVLEGGVGPA
jgi:hypothetical protein